MKGTLQFMKINEIFFSIEGEGKRSGQLAAFVRLTGCNLRCSYCDTRYAFHDGREVTAEEIADAVKDYRNVTLTGGEPLLQDCHKLLALLRSHDVNIETNGSIALTEYMNYKNVFFTMDFKCHSSGASNAMNHGNLKILREEDVLKFVVGDEADLEQARLICGEYKPASLIYISSVFGKIEASDIVDFMKRRHIENWRLQTQLHKIIWSPYERGV